MDHSDKREHIRVGRCDSGVVGVSELIYKIFRRENFLPQLTRYVKLTTNT